MVEENDQMRVGEVAEQLGIDARAVYDVVESGELKAERLPGHGIRLRRAKVERYVAVRSS